jgi:hypothetical protein
MDFNTVLGNGYVVASDDYMNLLVVWNGSATFNAWSKRDENTWVECEGFTHYEVENAFHAKQIAKNWIAEQYRIMEEYFGQEAA